MHLRPKKNVSLRSPCPQKSETYGTILCTQWNHESWREPVWVSSSLEVRVGQGEPGSGKRRGVSIPESIQRGGAKGGWVRRVRGSIPPWSGVWWWWWGWWWGLWYVMMMMTMVMLMMVTRLMMMMMLLMNDDDGAWCCSFPVGDDWGGRGGGGVGERGGGWDCWWWRSGGMVLPDKQVFCVDFFGDQALASFSCTYFSQRNWLKAARSCDQWLAAESAFVKYYESMWRTKGSPCPFRIELTRTGERENKKNNKWWWWCWSWWWWWGMVLSPPGPEGV